VDRCNPWHCDQGNTRQMRFFDAFKHTGSRSQRNLELELLELLAGNWYYQCVGCPLHNRIYRLHECRRGHSADREPSPLLSHRQHADTTEQLGTGNVPTDHLEWEDDDTLLRLEFENDRDPVV